METKRVVVQQGERAEVCIRTAEDSKTLVVVGPARIDVVISKSRWDNQAQQ
jgi:hypothetical protein